jgi:hypothetical protein
VNLSARGFEVLGPAQSCSPELSTLFHRLSNQLGVVLACAELLEAKSPDDAGRAYAAEVVAKTLDAMGTVREMRQHSRSSAA